jgi:hypothetical protein
MVDKARELTQLETMPYETQEMEQEELLREIGDKKRNFRKNSWRNTNESLRKIITIVTDFFPLNVASVGLSQDT